ncbi:MAG TPA: primosomal protein N', partial [Candidatus Acetothermia bacterium]|nr:primosomal protein N' [Candidatus Acetothermia bacterium]
MIARVLLPLPIDHPFDFAVGEDLLGKIAVGKRVVVRFHGREKTGIVHELAEKSDHPGALEPVLSVRPDPAFTAGALAFCLDTAMRYLSPPGPFVNRLLPRTVSTHNERYVRAVGKLDEIAANIQSLSKRAPRQAEALRYLLATGTPCPESDLKRKLKTSASVFKRLLDLRLIEEAPLEPEPRKATLTKSSTIKEGTAKQTLIFSRSRMEEYIRAIEEAQARGESTLMLEPGILIARAMFTKLQRSLAMPISLYHSGLPEGERGRIWNDASRQATHVVVGTRSALFLPFSKLGLVIVDEEQDRSYKQGEMIPHYHARDMVARMTSVEAIFGSAAPSIETFFSAQEGKIQLVHDSTTQTGTNTMIVDIKKEKGTLSAPLLAAIAETLAAKKRALIGVNARGHFQAVLCKKCGRPLRCPHCGANLTYDVHAAQLVCRVCGVTQPRMACPNCGSRSLRFVGIGSERIGDELRERFPSASIAHIDRSSLSSKAALARAEGAIDGEAQIIVATPLAAKGPI